jgi:hypothetical protein
MKTCSKCGIEKHENKFYKDKRAKDGLQSQCGVCQTISNKQYFKTPRGKMVNRKAIKKYQATPEGKMAVLKGNRRRRTEYVEFINKLKLKAGCSTCGFNADPENLDFHHKDPLTKLFNLSHGYKHKRDFVLIEIIKCEVTCKFCHKKFHKKVI